jgi:DnaJ family protein C protein 2
VYNDIRVVYYTLVGSCVSTLTKNFKLQSNSMPAIDFCLPSAPQGWDTSRDYKIHSKLAPLSQVELQPIGHAFVARLRRERLGRSIKEDTALQAALNDAADEAGASPIDDEPASAKLLARDPGMWKDQDMYAVIGLSKRRYLADDEEIKRAYRARVLKYHPDKTTAEGNTSDSFFKCIQRGISCF